MKKIIATSCIFIGLLFACKKDTTGLLTKSFNEGITTFRSELSNSRSSAYDLLFNDTHGVLSFKGTRQFQTADHASWSASGVFCPDYWSKYDLNNRVYKNVGNVKIDNITIPMESHKGYLIRGNEPIVDQFENLYGKNVVFSIAGSTESGYQPQSFSMYIPKKLNVSFSGYIESFSRPAIRRNTPLTITWQADASNSIGVLIKIENEHPIDKTLNPDMNSNKNYATNYILVEDDGSYTFNPSDFQNIPDMHELLITILRGNMAIEPNGSRQVKFHGVEEVFCPQFCLVE